MRRAKSDRHHNFSNRLYTKLYVSKSTGSKGISGKTFNILTLSWSQFVQTIHKKKCVEDTLKHQLLLCLLELSNILGF